MGVVIITGACGLVGSESVHHYCQKGYTVVGIDNDMRKYFFGEEASTRWLGQELKATYANFSIESIDIRDVDLIDRLFAQYSRDIELIIHTAAQPSHDWAAKEPFTDFNINATGTLNLLESYRHHCPKAVFLFTSTNKVYGDTPNSLPLQEKDTRWEIEEGHHFYEGIDESMSIDHSKHSLFGASKVAADIMVQEYGRYFGLKTGVFRGGCLTGPRHSGAELHGFLAYLMMCAVIGRPYNIFGYKGKQVRDNIHSLDLIRAFDSYFENPRSGEAYNIGGTRFSNCSLTEAVKKCETITGNKMILNYMEDNRIGDHIWYVSSMKKFKDHFPDWSQTKNINDILGEIFEKNVDKWKLVKKSG